MPYRERPTRIAEWFVPSRGPVRLRVAFGLLFLPYTAMVLCFVVLGSLLADAVYWDRLGALLVIYFLGLGVAAHALDAVGSRTGSPWGNVYSRRQLWTLAVGALLLAYGIGAYYMLVHVPLLWWIAIAEGFFVLAYNLEWFGGRFHTDGWFAVSWGALPVLAGFVMQTNAISASAVLLAGAMACISLVQIKVSRPYKTMKRHRSPDVALMGRLEAALKGISLGVVLLALAMLVWQWTP